MFRKYFLAGALALALTLSSHSVHSQGCSDAGFCTMGAMKPDQYFGKVSNLKLTTLDLSYYQGKTTLSPTVYAFNLDGSFTIGSVGLQLKGGVQWVDGNLAKTNVSLGDISVSASKTIVSKDKYSIGATIGAKISTGNGDLKGKEGETLPMYYQNNLGSQDLVGGISMLTRHWLIATGFQLPIIHHNQNDFLWSDWTFYPSPSYIQNHDVGVNLKRGTDVMLRVERNFMFSKFNCHIGVLNVYRVTKDQREIAGEYVKLDGTTGLALTAIGGMHYHFNTTSAVNLLFGIKITDRDVNPDGLTRENVFTLGYQYKF